MGANFAHDMAGMVGIEQGIALHLAHNHYPPVPSIMVAVCVAAIDAANAEEYDAPIELPEGVLWKGQEAVPAHVVIREFHLDAWIDDLG